MKTCFGLMRQFTNVTKAFVVLFVWVPISLVHVNAGADPELKRAANLIPWPQGKLQFDLEVETIEASSSCSEDLGSQSKLFVTIAIQSEKVSGQYTDSKTVEFSTKNSRISLIRTEFSAYLDEDFTHLVFSGSYRDDGGYTSINKQYLTLDRNQRVFGKINWEWTDREYNCIGIDLVTGILNF